MARTGRMSAGERREQLLTVGRSLFAKEGYEAVSVEEIAAKAGVSKPIVYEHFGGKEGLYAVVVDREMRAFTTTLSNALSDTSAQPQQLVERAAMALLGYIESNPEGFSVLARDSPITDPQGSFSSLLGDVSTRVESLLARAFRRHGIPVESAPYYAQMLVGMTIFVGQYWADRHEIGKETLAAYISNLAWNGLSRMHRHPRLRFEGSHPLESGEDRKSVAAPRGQTADRRSLKAQYKASKRRLKAEYKAGKHAAKAQMLEKRAENTQGPSPEEPKETSHAA